MELQSLVGGSGVCECGKGFGGEWDGGVGVRGEFGGWRMSFG